MKKIFLPCLIIICLYACRQKSTPDQAVSETERDTSINVANSYAEMFFDSSALEKFIISESLHDSAGPATS